MNVRNKSKMGLLSLGIAAMVGVSGTTLYSAVYAQSDSDSTAQTPLERPARPGRDLEIRDDHSAILADVLGISEEELQAAVARAREAAIAQAVTDGKLTQAQADAMLAEEGANWDRLGRGADHDAELATALGITPEELQAAKEEVKARVIAEAVASGEITQEEADAMAARQALQEYQRDLKQQEYEAMIAQAVTDGAITQAQADLLLSEQGPGFFGPGMDGGPRGGHMGGGHMDRGHMNGGHRGRERGGRDQQPPADSDNATPESSSAPVAPASTLDL